MQERMSGLSRSRRQPGDQAAATVVHPRPAVPPAATQLTRPPQDQSTQLRAAVIPKELKPAVPDTEATSWTELRSQIKVQLDADVAVVRGCFDPGDYESGCKAATAQQWRHPGI